MEDVLAEVFQSIHDIRGNDTRSGGTPASWVEKIWAVTDALTDETAHVKPSYRSDLALLAAVCIMAAETYDRLAKV